MPPWTSNDWQSNCPLFSKAGFRSEDLLSSAVIIPAFGNNRRLNSVIAALSRQTVPSHRWQVIIVDDGSNPPLEIPRAFGLDVKVLRQERNGFGAASARELGASRARGVDILVFLDSDMLPDEEWLEEHLKGHAHKRWVVACGSRTHVERTTISEDEVRDCNNLSEVFQDDTQMQPKWLEREWSNTSDGTRKTYRLWRVTSSGNLSVDTELYFACGGFDGEGFRTWGGEDNDFGYRAYHEGAIIIPVREAHAWHLGMGTSQGPGSESNLFYSRVQLAARIDDKSLPRIRGIVPIFPDVVLEIDCSQTDLDILLDALPKLCRVASDQNAHFTLDCRYNSYCQGILGNILAREPRISVLNSGEAPNAPLYPQCSRLVGRSIWRSWTIGEIRTVRGLVGEDKSGLLRVVDDDLNQVAEFALRRVARQVHHGILSRDTAFRAFAGRHVGLASLGDE